MPSGTKFAAIIIGSVLVALCAKWEAPNASAQIVFQNLNRRPIDERDSSFGVYLPTDRSLSRAMGRARARLATGEYHQSLGFLHEIFQREEDSFLDRTDNEPDERGLKATARQLISTLPPEGHDAYELLHGATARRQLDAALKSGIQDRIAAVVRQYFHTWAGYEAALVLAQMEADQGHHLAAAQLYRELINTPRAAERFEPQLSVLAALNQVADSRRDVAVQILRELAEKHPTAIMQLQGNPTAGPRPDADLLAWLFEVTGEPRPTRPAEFNWITARGNPQRNAEHPDGRPHLRPRWQARVVNEPGMESHLISRNDEFAQRRVVMFPAALPLAVDNVVVMRTPRNLVAVDWQTGKRIWETRDDEDLNLEDALSNYASGNDGEQMAQGNSLEQRMWDDVLVMSLSSDGERVFVIRGVSAASPEEIVAWQAAPGLGRRVDDTAAATNQLAAYDLATQGKLAWELDGSVSTGPLAGAFFLGAPLAIDNNLYVMAEIRSAIYLLALEPASGKVRWQQQLVGLEQGIALDPTRRLAGATPSYAGGILVCPTSAGAVVAVDIVKREFAWVYRYLRNIRSPNDAANIWQPQLQNQGPRANNHWLDGTALIADGRVVVTPPESDELHCLDLQSGKILWKHRRGDALLAACADEGNILLVGSDDLQALRLADGTMAWERQSLPGDAMPAGHGYLSDAVYYLPLNSGEILSVDMAAGTLNRYSAARPDAAFGNLICFRGSILSQSALVLDKYEQLDVLKRRAEQTLAQNPNDATALRELAELKRGEGQTSEAVTLLKRANELAPDEPLTREVLAELLLEALATDYAAFDDNVPLLAELIRDRQQQIELMRIEALGLDKLEKRLAAWNAYLRLADFTADQPEHLRIDSDYTVRSDRWIRGRLGALWSKATSEEQEAIASQLAARRLRLKDPGTAAELQNYLSYFDELPGSCEVRQRLAELLVKRGRLAEAEIELLQLTSAKQEAGQAKADSLMTELTKTASTAFPWPSGRVVGEMTAASSLGRERAERGQAEQIGHRQLRIEQDIRVGSPATQWFISADCSELVGRNFTGDDVFRLSVSQNGWAPQYRDSNLIYAARLGHLLFVALGGQILAIDSRQNQAGIEGNPLWQTGPSGHLSAEGIRGRRFARASQYRMNRRSAYHPLSSRKRTSGNAGANIGGLGPATPRGVVFQEQNQLKCVDPLSGETLWLRSDIPLGCELFGDDEFVFAADVSQRQIHVVRFADGQLVGKRELPKFEWLMTAGRCVAQLGGRSEGGNRALVLRIVDMWSQRMLFDAEYSIASRICVAEPDAVAVCDPTGRFQLIDVRTGQPIIEQTIEAVPDLQSIQTLRSGDSLFVMINRQSQHQQHKPLAISDYPLTDGLVYAFSMTSGEPIWSGPALVRNRGAVLSQPDDIPMLVFADHRIVRDAGSGGRMQLRLLCLDKRTGETVYRNDNLPETAVAKFRVRAERQGDAQVTVETSSSRIKLLVTDRGKPPQPPANDELEAVREIGRRGLLGLGEKMLRGAISDPAVRRPPAKGGEASPPMDDD
jgi:outer membrane protein assembly factor BamB